MKTFRIHFNHNYWENGNGYSHSETMESWLVKGESFEDLRGNLYFDMYEGENFNISDDKDIKRMAECKEGDTEIELEAFELDEDGNEIESKILMTCWLSDLATDYLNGNYEMFDEWTKNRHIYDLDN